VGSSRGDRDARFDAAVGVAFPLASARLVALGSAVLGCSAMATDRPSASLAAGSQAAEVAEAELVAALRGGEPWAFELFVRTHGARVKVVASRYLRNEEDANDAVQETFLSAFKALGSFAGKSQLATWLHRIAVNAALMKLRALSRRREETAEEEIEDLLPKFVGLGVHPTTQRAFGESPDEPALRQEACARVRSAIMELPENHRIALVLRDIEGLEYEEVARQLGISINAAKIRIHRARQALRTLLEPHFGVSDA
jgi:RNA polymerase sigma-70 factor (ECF subfamily)